MVLVDTSVWIDHLKKSHRGLRRLLDRNEVLSHPFVIGELAVGSFKNRDAILFQMQLLPAAISAGHDEILQFISRNKLSGLGIGYVDAHLLAATQLTPFASFWTRDKRLAKVAETLRISYQP